MVVHATEQQDVGTRTSPHTRAVPAFKVVMTPGHATTTEDHHEGSYFPDGIDFGVIKPITPTVTQSLDDQLAVLELLDDE